MLIVAPGLLRGTEKGTFSILFGTRLAHGRVFHQNLLGRLLPDRVYVWTGRKPTLRTVEMLRFYFTGWADADELEAHIAKLHALEA